MKRRVRQTGKAAPSQAVHARHNRQDTAYTWQQYRAEQAELIEEAERRALRKAQEEEAA